MNTPLLAARGLCKRYGALAVTDHVDLTIAQERCHALIGPNGAGKTTLIEQIAGALPADAGRIVFDGTDVTREPIHVRALRGIVRSFQISNHFGRLSVLDNIALAVQGRSGSSMRFWSPARSEHARYEEAARVAARVGLGARVDITAGRLAHGEHRRLELALALAMRPKLLLLDEPMAGIGAADAPAMFEMLAALRAQTPILLVEHDLDTVFRLADRISVLVAGRIIASGTPDAIRNHPDVRRAYLGDDVEHRA